MSRPGAYFRMVCAPVDVADETQFPNIARARREFRDMPRAKRERLEREWRS